MQAPSIQNHAAKVGRLQIEFLGLDLDESSLFTSGFSFVLELTIGPRGTGPGFKSWAGLEACLLASSRWEPTLLSRPSPSEARL